ncbi:MAG: D-2-hydroxyacid dehydrogenase [Anaerolineae bacterium]
MKLLLTVPWPEAHLLSLKTAFPQVEFMAGLTKDTALQHIPEAEVVFGDFSGEVFLAAKKLRWIQCHGAGVNKLMAIPELVESDVLVTNTRGAHAPTIAEHFFGILISLTRRLPQLYLAQQRREWVEWSAWPEKVGQQPIGLQGMILGIVGLGNIGRAIAERARAFGMTILTVDVHIGAKPDYVAELWPLEKLPELCQRSDVVVVAVPGTPQTEGLISRDLLSLMKPTAYLSVVSRGGIVDEPALADMLRAGRLAGAALDVTAAEPLPASSPLWDAPNLILTPHCAGKSDSTTAAATEIFRDNLERYLSGRPLINLVDKQLGF